MRLTLRTMLAYLDNILEPEDAKDIGNKIEGSQYATSLLHRIRDVMRRLRLSAPSVAERGPGLDANTVAEYLDNTLSSDRVPDFEKVCLESDIYLSEVASCHQVLAAVLGEPAEIDPESRQRMYQLPQAAAQAAAESRGGDAATSGDGRGTADAALQGSRPKPTVPEYLREPPKKRRLLTTLTLLVLAGCFTGAVLWALGQFDPKTPVGHWLRTGRWNTEVAATQDSEKEEPEPVKSAPAVRPEKTTGPSQPTKEQPKTSKAASPDQPPVVPTTGTAAHAPAPLPLHAKPGPNPDVPAHVPPAAPTEIAKIEPKLPGPPANQPAAPDSKLPPTPAIEQGKPAPEGPEGPEPIKPPERIGHLVSGEDKVLLSYNQKAGYWERVAPKGSLVSQQRLLAPPTYRDEISIGSGAAVELLGGTRVQLLPGSEKEPVGLAIDFGRLALVPSQEAAKLRLTVGSHSGLLTMTDNETFAALEVTRSSSPGANPESDASHAAADLYVTHGAILWQEKGMAEPLRIIATARLTLDEQSPHDLQTLASKDLPKWIVLESLGALEQRASASVAQSLQGGRSAGLGLMELAYHRQKEVAWLARRSLGYIDQFEPLVAALNNIDCKADWPKYVEQLRQGIARGPESAAAIHQAMEKQYGQEESPQLFRMLWGYTNKQLQNGADAKLVALLEHPTLAFRVLAFWNLKEITGLGLYYKPEETPAKNRQFVVQWKKRCESGDIRIKSPESKTPPREPDGLPPPPPTPMLPPPESVKAPEA